MMSIPTRAASLCIVALGAAETSVGSAAPAEPQQSQVIVTRPDARTARPGPETNFTGTVQVEPLARAEVPARISGGRVTFQPVARTAWHSHPAGQTLSVTDGVGRVQQWNGPVQEIRPGDVVWIPPGQKHWHGASPTSSMTHVALAESLDGKVVDWMEKVSDEQYGKE